jgi:hypothetical protein
MTSIYIQGRSCAAVVALAVGLAACDSGPPPALEVSSVAAPKNIATGGDALIQVALPEGASASRVTLSVNGTEVKADIKAGAVPNALVAKVSGLNVGSNKVAALYRGTETGSVSVTNYGASGPVFSGPHQSPFVCTTDLFKLPITDATLGKATDEACNAPTRVDYVYRSTEGTFKPLPNPKELPADVATTTTMDNKSVKYIVRVETGTANRAIYQTAVLHDPNTDKAVDIWTRPAGWNGRLVYTYGGGYGAAFNQGVSTGGVLNDLLLSRGYGVASSTLNVGSASANDVISAETTLLVREKFMETYGPVVHTLGWGTSGGAMQQHHITQNYPGLLDGIIPAAASPDSVTRVGFVSDCTLLSRFFDAQQGKWTEEQKTAISGFATWKTCTGGDGFSGGSWIGTGYSHGWINPKHCAKAIPADVHYDAVSNPKGARCTYQDDMANIFGRDETGKARRPLDSVGVQYGLQAYTDGKITAAQFIELNEKLGGWDIDGQWQPERTVADQEALRLAYETGRVNQGGGGMAYTPIIDLRTYTDPFDFHDRVRALVTKARMIATNGDVANRAMIMFSGKSAGPRQPYDGLALEKMEEWLAKISTDSAAGSYRQKVIRSRPADLTEACFDEEGTKIEEPMEYGVDNKCNALFPPHGDVRMAAGSPIKNDVLKCQLKPVDAADYPASMTPALLKRAKAVFPDGVCDWSQPGVAQTKQVGVWLRYDGTGRYSPMP